MKSTKTVPKGWYALITGCFSIFCIFIFSGSAFSNSVELSTNSGSAFSASSTNNSIDKKLKVRINKVEAITPENQPNTAALMDKVKKGGWVRVIIILDIPTTPEGYLPTHAHVNNQRQLIDFTQSALLNRIRANDIKSVKRFKYVPMIAMTVAERGLQALIAAPGTKEIVEDGIYFPTLLLFFLLPFF